MIFLTWTSTSIKNSSDTRVNVWALVAFANSNVAFFTLDLLINVNLCFIGFVLLSIDLCCSIDMLAKLRKMKPS